MDWLYYEMAGRPPRPSFGHWLTLCVPRTDASPGYFEEKNHHEWLRDAPPEVLQMTLEQKNALLCRVLNEPLPQLLSIERIVDMAETLMWKWTCERNLYSLARDAGGISMARQSRLAEMIADWQLTPMQEKLFRLLDKVKQDNATPDGGGVQFDDDDEVLIVDNEGGLSEPFVISKLYSVRLRDIAAAARKRCTDRLRRLVADLQRKLDVNETGLFVGRPRPKTLALDWDGPNFVAGQEIPPPNELQACMEAIRAALSSGPQDASKVRRSLREHGYSSHHIRKAREKLDVRSRRAGFGSEGGWLWELPFVS